MSITKLAAAALATLALTGAANALTWTWSTNGGLDSGTFTTDGDALAGAAGTYTFTGFTYDVSSQVNVGLFVNAFDHNGGATSQTMTWNGSQATQFARSYGATTYTNGSNFTYSGVNSGAYNNLRVSFGVNVALIGDTDYSPYNFFNTLDIALAPTAAVPVPASLPMALAGVAGLVALARRKRA